MIYTDLLYSEIGIFDHRVRHVASRVVCVFLLNAITRLITLLSWRPITCRVKAGFILSIITSFDCLRCNPDCILSILCGDFTALCATTPYQLQSGNFLMNSV